MIRIVRWCLLGFCMVCASAQAAVLDLSYTSSDGTVVTASFSGLLVAFDQDVGVVTPLGAATTDGGGSYSIQYNLGGVCYPQACLVLVSPDAKLYTFESFNSTDLNENWSVIPVNGSWVLRGADIGQIASPVPEPETYAMLLAGLGLIGFTARRRKGLNP